jgi:hypothetical protein
MIEFITQNPIIALILAIVPVAAVMWKVFHELYVKPRDFRIDVLKEDMARLSSQLEEVRNLRASHVVAESGGTGALPHTEVLLSDSKALEELPVPVAGRPARPANRIEQTSQDSQSPDRTVPPTATSAQTSRSPADSLAALYERWRDPAMTELQKQKFERDWIGKEVRWLVWVDSVGEASHGRIFISARDGSRDQFAAPRTLLVCPERDAELLLTLRPGDSIAVSGKIREFFVSPSVDVSAIERA